MAVADPVFSVKVSAIPCNGGGQTDLQRGYFSANTCQNERIGSSWGKGAHIGVSSSGEMLPNDNNRHSLGILLFFFSKLIFKS